MYTIILGCSRVGSELAQVLQKEGHNVVVIDKKEESFDLLGKAFNGVKIIGDGLKTELLKEAGIEKADALISVTDEDNVNIVTGQVAQKIFKVPKVIIRIYDPQKARIYHNLGFEVISGTSLVAARIRDALVDKDLVSFLTESSQLGVLRVEVKKRMRGKSLKEVNIPGEFLTIAVIKKNGHQLADPDMLLEEGDILMGAVRIKSLNKIKKRLMID